MPLKKQPTLKKHKKFLVAAPKKLKRENLIVAREEEVIEMIVVVIIGAVEIVKKMMDMSRGRLVRRIRMAVQKIMIRPKAKVKMILPQTIMVAAEEVVEEVKNHEKLNLSSVGCLIIVLDKAIMKYFFH